MNFVHSSMEEKHDEFYDQFENHNDGMEVDPSSSDDETTIVLSPSPLLPVICSPVEDTPEEDVVLVKEVIVIDSDSDNEHCVVVEPPEAPEDDSIEEYEPETPDEVDSIEEYEDDGDYEPETPDDADSIDYEDYENYEADDETEDDSIEEYEEYKSSTPQNLLSSNDNIVIFGTPQNIQLDLPRLVQENTNFVSHIPEIKDESSFDIAFQEALRHDPFTKKRVRLIENLCQTFTNHEDIEYAYAPAIDTRKWNFTRYCIRFALNTRLGRREQYLADLDDLEVEMDAQVAQDLNIGENDEEAMTKAVDNINDILARTDEIFAILAKEKYGVEKNFNF